MTTPTPAEVLGPVVTAIDHVGTFGLTMTHRETNEEQGVEEAMLGVGNAQIQLLAALRPDSSIGKFLDRNGEGIQHIALSTDDIYATVERLRAAGVKLMAPPPATYYEALDQRLPGHGEDVARLQSLGILMDGSPTHDG